MIYKRTKSDCDKIFIMAATASSWRSNLKPVKPLQTTSPRRKPAALEMPRNIPLSKTWPRENFEATSPRETTTTKSKSPTSRWSHLSSSSRLTVSPRRSASETLPQQSNRITADELLSREFSPAKYSSRHRSSVFLRTVEVFEGAIPGRLRNEEDPRQIIAEEKFDFCSTEMVDMKKFIEQIEEEFLSLRKRIEYVKYNMADLKSAKENLKISG